MSLSVFLLASYFFGNFSIKNWKLFAGFGKTYSKLIQENEMAKGNSSKPKHSSLSLQKNKNINHSDIIRSPLVFVVHPYEPTTSTPVQVSGSARMSRFHQDIFEFGKDTQLSPIILDRENICDISKRTVPTTCKDEEVKRKSGVEMNDCNQSTDEAGILTSLQKSSPQLTILNSPGRWGFKNEEHVCEDVTIGTSAQGDKSLSLCDGTGTVKKSKFIAHFLKDNRPFYLNGFPWTAQYARRRNYKQELFHLCIQKSIQPWRLNKTILDLSNPVKLGEGTFGEVFRINYKGEIVALKVIPIGGTKIVNGDKQKSFRDITAELIVSKELSDLGHTEDGYSTQGFIHLRGAIVVKGSYPKSLITAWEHYDKLMKSENDHPCIFNSNQHFLLLAFEDGGIDLEKYVITSVLQAYSIIYQVLLALSVAEYRLSFEHRDLHCGNILIRNVQSDAAIKANYSGIEVSVPTHGVEVKIIDFTLSRMSKGPINYVVSLKILEEF
uniref:Protein kinase domain-containing protein n=1 Tax=Elaeophora elaphi TaxID=1147741 RepID=A0A0R3RGM4_9BILA